MLDQRAPTARTTAPVGPRFRAAFQHDLRRLELDLQEMAVLSRNALQRAVRALVDDHQRWPRRWWPATTRSTAATSTSSGASSACWRAIDNRVDELNRSMLVALAASAPLGRLEWSVHLYEAARQLERAGDHAVDIAEQVWFLVTGELIEFGGTARTPTPASTPATSA